MVAVVSISWWFCFEGRERVADGWWMMMVVNPVNPALVARWLASREGTPNCWLSFGNLKESQRTLFIPRPNPPRRKRGWSETDRPSRLSRSKGGALASTVGSAPEKDNLTEQPKAARSLDVIDTDKTSRWQE